MNYFRSIKMHLLRQTNICALCGKAIENLSHASIDHIVPRSKGGPDSLKNLQLAHSWCNSQKGNRVEPGL
jgi:5-methylcytosine-specific restriction endonuclease McrA